MDKKKILLIAVVVFGLVLIALVIALPFIIQYFLAAKFGLIDSPVFPQKNPIQVLVVGEPSVDFLSLLDQDKKLVYVRIRDPSALDVVPSEQLAQYDLVILDQHLSSNKAVSRQFGGAVEGYVMTGGKLITVMDSGIYRSGGMTGEGREPVAGWAAVFGDIMPVACDKGNNNVPTCTQPIQMTARIYSSVYGQDIASHPIMRGLDVSPSHPAMPPYNVTTFNVKPTGDQIAFIKDALTDKYYPAIVEKKLVAGKSIYFNYDPGLTPGVWINTLDYLFPEKHSTSN